MRSQPTAVAGELLERGAQLEALHEALDTIDARGRLVLVGGEAGVGKTALVGRFCEECADRVRVLWGACDALFTPRPLGPFLDFADGVAGDLQDVVGGGGSPHDVVAALTHKLRGRLPTVLVLEDLHWADEATLDVLRLLARRLEATPALVIGTYRDDELEATHPLRIVLGDLATRPVVERLHLEPLSSAAVGALAAISDFDGADLHRVTGGNPFFITEVLAAPSNDIPATVRDAVLARTARLGAEARRLLEAIAVVPREAELWLVEALVPDARGCLDEALASGVVTAGSNSVRFRHELARRAVEQAAAPHDVAALHRLALAALIARPAEQLDPARIAHHAEAADDGQAVSRFAPVAALRAARHGAHREAAAQYARALRFAGGRPPAQRAELLTQMARECFLIDDSVAAIHALEDALVCHRDLGDDRREADTLTELSNVMWCPGRIGEALANAERAVSLLEGHPPGRQLVAACSVLATLHKDGEDTDATRDWAERAIGLAERLDEAELALQVRITLHGLALVRGEPGAREELDACRHAAARDGLEEQMSRVSVHLAWAGLRHRTIPTADADVAAGIDHARAHGLDLHETYLVGYRSQVRLYQGDWDAALSDAAAVLRHTQVSRVPRVLGLVVTGLIAARRGDPDARSVLDDALAIAQPSGELQRLGPAAAARAEAAWLEHDTAGVERATATALALAIARDSRFVIGELAAWRSRAGLDPGFAGALPEPYGAQLAGDWSGAAAFWDRQGCPYEAAMARADADVEGALRRALEQLNELGATKAVALVARRLRRRGARGLPRGPRPATRVNPAQLTARELEVLGLVATGLRNAEIADRLYVSQRTIDTHVSAILRKLGVRTRGEAGAEAARLGLVSQDR
jgi:DNA-binding CsgD family transcriptional regulator